MFGVLGLLARLVDDGPVGRHVVFPRNSYPRAFRTECPFEAFLHLTRGLEPDNLHGAGFCGPQGEKPTTSHIPSNLEPRLIAARPSIFLRFLMSSGAKCEVNLLINSCLAFWKMAGVPDSARDMVRRAAGHDIWQ